MRERPDPKEQEQEREREQEQDGGKESKDDILRELGEQIEKFEKFLEEWKGGKQKKDG